MVSVDAPARDWAASGLAYLTGAPDGPPDFSRAAVLTRAREVAARFRAETGVDVDAAALLAGRAALQGLTRSGRVSAGGASRLFAARDGWCALTLSRRDDVDAVPALVEADAVDPWEAVEAWARVTSAADVAARARLLGLPAAVLGEHHGLAVTRRPHAPTADHGALLVVDMSSMWAGPLCGRLLLQAGATVVKVESPRRPDGTRSGTPAFFDWMNGGKLSYAVDVADTGALHALLAAADVVIQSSRPEAMARRALGPDDVPVRSGRVWVRITGYGADGDAAQRVAFGDDAAVAGGLVGSGPVFCGDAIADPLTGLQAAVEAVAALQAGGGVLIDVAMAGVAAEYARLPLHAESGYPATAPGMPPCAEPAASLGADNDVIARLIDERLRTPC
jgi:hypothetical protein